MYAPISLNNVAVDVIGRENAILPEARQLFTRALMAGSLRRLTAAVTRQSRRLLVLAEEAAPVGNRAHLGVRTVALDDIAGTLDKADAFDRQFHPRREDMLTRWAGVAGAVLRGETLPPVELILVGDTYYVVDGHHRISVARALGQAAIEAVVTEWKTA